MESYKAQRTFVKLLAILSSLSLCSASIARATTTEDNITAQAVSRIYGYMNVTINPCENFYEYSCGNWLKSHSQVINSEVNNLDKIYNDKIKNIIEGIDQMDYKDSDNIMARLRIYYKSCKQQQSFNITSYMDVIRPMHNEVWPQAGEPWHPKSKWNVWLTLGRLAGIGLKDLLFSVSWKKDNFPSYQLALRVCSNMWQEAVSKSRFPLMDKNVMVFLEQLNDLCEKHNNSETKQMTISELQQKVPNIEFIAYFSGLLEDNIPLNSVSITIENLPYYRDLGDLIQRTSQDTLIQIMKVFLGRYLEDNLPNDCVSNMRQVLPLALNYIYEKYEYQQHKRTTDEVVRKIFTNLQNKFIGILKQHSDEFTFAERIFLNEKILKMRLNIGNLQLETDNDFYKNYYHKWLVGKENFFENHLNALKHKTLEDLGVLSAVRPFSATTFENVLQVFYPFYLFSKNIIVVPFQYLAYPEDQPQLQELLQYADLGYSMSHAMMYGFSAFGLQYNAAGIRNIPFSQALLKKPLLHEAMKCLNASNSIEVDIKMTDFIGFRLAYDTYFQQSVVPEIQTHLDLNDKQLFYLKFAQSECTVRRLPTYIELPLAIQNIVANSVDFEEVFGCFQDMGVIPRTKCQIW